MVMIFSTEDIEWSTIDVIQWLYHYKIPFIRINGEQLFEQYQWSHTLNTLNEDLTIHIKEKQEINLQDIKAVWYRTGGQIENFPDFEKITDKVFQKVTHQYALDEMKAHLEILFNVLSREKPCLTYPNARHNINKLDTLYRAKSAGLDIPNTIITSDKEKLIEFYNNNAACIIKSIDNPTRFPLEEETYFPYTELITDKFIDNLPDTFFPSLLQELLVKQYEIRTFYLDGDCYSMAIFSQKNDNTKIDFRRYDNIKPNRSVPYKLPENIEGKIKRFMESVNLNNGSLDIIKTTDNRYVFLEVNPLGQFGMTSIPCNYYLEEKIAQWMIKHEKVNV